MKNNNINSAHVYKTYEIEHISICCSLTVQQKIQYSLGEHRGIFSSNSQGFTKNNYVFFEVLARQMKQDFTFGIHSLNSL